MGLVYSQFGRVFFVPDMGGLFLEHANFEPANVLQTPEHIAPMVVLHAVLRHSQSLVPYKLLGVIIDASLAVPRLPKLSPLA